MDKEKFKDIKRVIRSRKQKKDRQYNGQGQKDKQWCTEHHTENQILSITNACKYQTDDSYTKQMFPLSYNILYNDFLDRWIPLHSKLQTQGVLMINTSAP